MPNQPNYLIYSYILDKVYPLFPLMPFKKEELIKQKMKIMAAVADKLPFEKDMSHWYLI
jgi:hypothetical protein